MHESARSSGVRASQCDSAARGMPSGTARGHCARRNVMVRWGRMCVHCRSSLGWDSENIIEHGIVVSKWYYRAGELGMGAYARGTCA